MPATRWWNSTVVTKREEKKINLTIYDSMTTGYSLEPVKCDRCGCHIYDVDNEEAEYYVFGGWNLCEECFDKERDEFYDRFVDFYRSEITDEFDELDLDRMVQEELDSICVDRCKHGGDDAYRMGNL